jgi:hypothetical protein
MGTSQINKWENLWEKITLIFWEVEILNISVGTSNGKDTYTLYVMISSKSQPPMQ